MRAVLAPVWLSLVAVVALGVVGCGGGTPSAEPSVSLVSSSAPSASSTSRLMPSVRPVRVFAAQVASAESVLAAPGSTVGAVRAAGEFEQLAVRALSEARAGVRKRVLARLRGRAHRIIAADLAADGGLRSITPPQPSLPPWRIVDPLPARQLMRIYRRAARTTGVPWTYLAAINFVETKFGRIVGPSYAGAQGPMQFMPATWAAYGRGGDVHDPRDAIPAAARYLRAHGAPRDMTRALYAYNHSTSYVNAVRSYAGVMRRWPRSFLGYRAWRVLYRARSGVWVLPLGYPKAKAIRLSAD
ncbi:MAG: lytic murein transglycosylase [Nocardioides sp.]